MWDNSIVLLQSLSVNHDHELGLKEKSPTMVEQFKISHYYIEVDPSVLIGFFLGRDFTSRSFVGKRS